MELTDPKSVPQPADVKSISTAFSKMKMEKQTHNEASRTHDVRMLPPVIGGTSKNIPQLPHSI
jgi:hypothetical protein